VPQHFQSGLGLLIRFFLVFVDHSRHPFKKSKKSSLFAEPDPFSLRAESGLELHLNMAGITIKQ